MDNKHDDKQSMSNEPFNITAIIKAEVQRLFLFNQVFDELSLEFKQKPFDPSRWDDILPEWLPPAAKANILEILPEDDVVHMLVGDTALLKDLLKYLCDRLIVATLFAATDYVTVPLLLDTDIIFTEERLSRIEQDNAFQFYSLDFHLYIADRITRDNSTGLETLSERCVPDNHTDRMKAYDSLKPYVTDKVYKDIKKFLTPTAEESLTKISNKMNFSIPEF